MFEVNERDMEAPQEEVIGVSKGKRTKRVRPQSLIPFLTINNAHSSSNGDANVDGTVYGEEVSIINNNNNNNNNNSTSPPPIISDENIPDEDVPTKEEEETAKCLILLSQGGHHHYQHHRHQTPPKRFLDLFNDDMGLYQTKFNSKRYVETTDLGNGAKGGTYVYECKTCNRTFSSFQALGGHRASHKKPKPLTIEPKKQPFFYFSDQDEPSPPAPTSTNYKYNNKLSPLLSPLSSQFNNIIMDSPTYNKSPSPRIHTCSYCGAEFTSGQALGGHMRRHRGGANNNNNTILCLSPLSIDQEFANNSLKKPRNGLSLDLNLPAPQDFQYQNQSRNLQYPPKYPQEQAQKQQQQEQQQTALVLSTTPQLIDCHY